MVMVKNADEEEREDNNILFNRNRSIRYSCISRVELELHMF
jgi:hypothetical protein